MENEPTSKTTEPSESTGPVNLEAEIQERAQSTGPVQPPNRPASTASSITGKVLEIDPEALNQLDSPTISGPPVTPTEEDNEDDDDGSAGYEESAERDEIIRERINRTQEQMR